MEYVQVARGWQTAAGINTFEAVADNLDRVMHASALDTRDAIGKIVALDSVDGFGGKRCLAHAGNADDRCRVFIALMRLEALFEPVQLIVTTNEDVRGSELRIVLWLHRFRSHIASRKSLRGFVWREITRLRSSPGVSYRPGMSRRVAHKCSSRSCESAARHLWPYFRAPPACLC